MDSGSLTLAEEKELETSVSPTPRESISKERNTELGDIDREKENVSNHNDQAPAGSGEENEGEYPDATRMAFVVIALLLSIFLVWTLHQFLLKRIMLIRFRSPLT